MIRVPVPIDLSTISETKSGAFSLASPLQVEELLALAIAHDLGPRAPREKRERAVLANLDAFRAGKFVVDIDGRIYDRPDTIVVITGTATLRFFSTDRAILISHRQKPQLRPSN